MQTLLISKRITEMNEDEWGKLNRLMHSPSVMALYELKQKKKKEVIDMAWEKLASCSTVHGGKAHERNRK